MPAFTLPRTTPPPLNIVDSIMARSSAPTVQMHRQFAAAQPSLPFEIFLAVMDVLIAEAVLQASLDQTRFWLVYLKDSPSKIALADTSIISGCPHALRHQVVRFDSLRLALQATRKTRDMVHRKILRFPMTKHRQSTDLIVDAASERVDGTISVADMERDYLQAVHLPTPLGDSMLRSVQKLWLPFVHLLHESNPRALAGIAAFPSLRTITFMVDDYLPTLDLPGRRHHSPVPLMNPFFPDLEQWMASSAGFHAMWRPFAKRGVRLYGVRFDTGAEQPFLEVVSTPNGMHSIGGMFLHPDCGGCWRCARHGEDAYWDDLADETPDDE
ncbi:hypothetical protein CPLU01_09848 [Colletotrichum plurivorum]|uniref:Uncharacterized protein n=1 Tax=Colletotrichum plurivorum TaxID=2175906 RepID=A0A8H6K7Z3_9PEZI|nr:hypothetical protein CPLU01_09848 [Colletotrichum plurivorum]